jgi:polar amino acid transport system substrate-binding protein
MSVDVGREMARRLGGPARIVELERVEQVIEALRSGQADMTITNASAARAALVDFTEPALVAIELGYLVVRGSPVTSIADVDRPGVRVGVSQGSSSQAALGKAFRNASLVPASSLKVAADLLKEGRIDAFATNKGVLFQLADGLPDARVLDGRWGTESLALAVPKGREAGKARLADFIAKVRQEGFVKGAAQRAGLRGLAEAEVR